MALTPVWAGLVACAVTLVATPPAAVLARRAGIVDHPGPLKPQQRAVPYLGGLAVGAGVAVGTALGAPALLLLPPAAAMLLGLADDRLDLPVSLRLVAEVAIGAGVALAAHAGGPLLAVVAVVATVAAVNGVNLIDGMDGLAGGVAGMAAVGFAVLAGGHAQVLAAALAGALAGFLAYNRPPARIYLGDAGSYLLGTVLAELLVLAWRTGGAAAPAALVLLAYPAGELGSAVLRRWRAHRPLFEGDRDHTYDRLAKAGWSTGRVSLACAGGQAVVAALAVGICRLPPGWAWAAAAVAVAALAGGAARAGLLRP